MVDVNNLPDFLVFAAARAKRKGAKIVLDMHEITPEFYISKYGIAEDSWPVRVLTSIEQRSLRFANHVLTINDPIQDLLRARTICKSFHRNHELCGRGVCSPRQWPNPRPFRRLLRLSPLS